MSKQITEETMKCVSAIMLTLGMAAGLLSASVTPAMDSEKEVAVNNNPMPARAQPAQDQNGAIQIIAPQQDLETAIRASGKGDILLYGPEGWYRLEGKVLQQGTRVYVLGKQGSSLAVFPKESETTVR